MRILIAVLLLVLVFSVSSCSRSEPNLDSSNKPATSENNSPPSASAAKDQESETTGTEALSNDAKASREEIEATDAAKSGLGPTDTIRALNDAVIKKDAAKIKSFLTRGSIRLIEQSAKEQGKTIDQILTSEDGAPMPVEREMRNESVSGNEATVEVKNSVLGSYDKMYLIKEDGNWRIAFDKFQDEMMRKLNELQKDAPKIDR